MLFKSQDPEPQFKRETVFENVFNNAQVLSPNMPMYLDADDPDNYISFGDLKKNILKMAAGLKREYNIQKGDIVSICSPNVIEYPMVMYATTVAGGTFSAINFSTQDPECIARDLALVNTKYLIVHPITLSLALKAAQIIGLPKSSILTLGQTVGHIRSVKQVLLNHNELASPMPLTQEEFETHPVYLYFTSGTTGTPKAVIITHKMMINALGFIRHPLLSNPALSRFVRNSTHALLTSGCLYHVSGLTFTMHVSLKLGVRTYLMKRYDFESVCKNIQKYRITDAPFAPWGLAELARNPIADKYDLSSLSLVVSTGSGLDTSIAKAILQKYDLPVLNAYGMSEMWSICHPDLQGGLEQVGLPGKLCCGTEAKLIDENGKELGPGEAGELLIRGPGLTPGYYNDPKGSATLKDKDGFLHTGDLCIIDNNGVLNVIERLKDTINYRHTWISAKEVETILMSVPSVVDCAVVGIRTPDGEELPTAYVSLVDDMPHPVDIKEKLLGYAHSHLHQSIRLVGGIHIVKQFPRTPIGKIQKRILRQLGEREALQKHNKEAEERRMKEQDETKKNVDQQAAIVDKLQVA